MREELLGLRAALEHAHAQGRADAAALEQQVHVNQRLHAKLEAVEQAAEDNHAAVAAVAAAAIVPSRPPRPHSAGIHQAATQLVSLRGHGADE